MTMADKDSPLTYGTLGWLWHNLPITVWFELRAFSSSYSWWAFIVREFPR